MATLRERGTSSLVDKLASILPKGYHFGVYHISTPPNRTDALYSAPPDERPDKTYCESHFLAISIDKPTTALPAPTATPPSPDPVKPVLVLALEVLIFTTAYTTTIFVSKADSTGYLHLLGLPKGTPSPIREVCSAFVSYLVAHRRRKDVSTILTLFARAQGQYLFPGSVENKGKHVLDDRGLVKWWCKVLNAALEGQEGGSQSPSKREQWESVKGYLIVPGLDSYETRAFLPRTPHSLVNWSIGHPLERISHYSREYDWVPPRCLIPRYPDDPKSRFRDELDQEAGRWKQTTGAWKSIRTVNEFWDMMAFRQECSSGRLTGFVWVVFDPEGCNLERATSPAPPLLTPASSFDATLSGAPPSTPPRRPSRVSITPQSAPRRLDGTPASTMSTPSKSRAAEQKKQKKKLTGRIVPRQPHVKTQQRNYLLDRPASTAYYYWPPDGRGEKIVDEADYKRSVELLLHLDFATLEKTTSSTKRWISEIGVGRTWGVDIVGRRELPAAAELLNPASGATAGAVNNLSGLVKRKRPAENTGESSKNGSAGGDPAVKVTVLGAGLIRKKRKDTDAPAP